MKCAKILKVLTCHVFFVVIRENNANLRDEACNQGDRFNSILENRQYFVETERQTLPERLF